MAVAVGPPGPAENAVCNERERVPVVSNSGLSLSRNRPFAFPGPVSPRQARGRPNREISPRPSLPAHERPVRSGGRPACRRGGRLAPREFHSEQHEGATHFPPGKMPGSTAGETPAATTPASPLCPVQFPRAWRHRRFPRIRARPPFKLGCPDRAEGLPESPCSADRCRRQKAGHRRTPQERVDRVRSWVCR